MDLVPTAASKFHHRASRTKSITRTKQTRHDALRMWAVSGVAGEPPIGQRPIGRQRRSDPRLVAYQ